MKMKTLFFIYNKSQAEKAWQYSQRSIKKENIILFPLNNEAYFYLKSKGINLKKITTFFLKKQKSRFPDSVKLNKNLSNLTYFKKLTINKDYRFLELNRIYLDYWLAILFETQDFITKAIKYFKPHKIIVFKRSDLKSFSHNDISFSFLNFSIRKVKPDAKVILIKENKPIRKMLKNNHLFLLIKIFIYNLLNNPISLLKLAYYFSQSRLNYYFTKNKKKATTYNILLHAHKHQLNNLIPLINKIKKEEIFNLILITGDLKLKEMILLEKHHIKHLNINKFSGHNKETKINLKYKKILKSFNSKKSKLALNNFFIKKKQPFLGIPYYYLLQKTVKTFFKQNFRYYYSIKKIFEILKPDLIININDFKISSLLLIKEAKHKRIPTLLLQHGLSGSEKIIDFVSDYYFAWGKHPHKTCYTKKSDKRKKQVKICGNFYIDHIRRDFKQGKLDFNNKSRLQNKKLITIGCLTTIYISEFKHAVSYHQLAKKISAAKLNNKKFQVLFRTHPGQSLAGIRSYKSSLLKFIKASDIIITEDTTAAINAMLYQKPLIYFNPCYKYLNPTFLKYKATLFATNINDVVKQIKKIVSDPVLVEKIFKNQKKLIYDCCYKLDGKSCNRVVSFIKEIVEPKNKN